MWRWGAEATDAMGRSFTDHGKASPSHEEMVRESNPREPRADARPGCIQPTQPARHRPLAEAVGQRSRGRKSPPYRSAMSMLTFYINRGGAGLSGGRRRTLEAAKGELRRLFGKQKA